jgi:hypothetical protein
VDIVAYGTFVLADHYTKLQSDARYVEVAGDTMTGGLNITSGNLGIGTSSPSDYSSSAYDLVVAGSGQRGITIASTDSVQSNLFFADATSGSGEYAGYIAYNHGSDYLIFGANSSERLRITSAGNVGIGVTPSAWGSAWVATQVGAGSTIAGRTTDYTNTNIVSNAYFDGTNWRYLSTNTASKYYQLSGNHIFDYAASGTSGNTVTFSEAMRIDSSGRVGIGRSPSSGYKLDIEANNQRSRLLGTTGYVASEVTNNGGSVTLAKENSSGGGFMPTTGAYDSVLVSQGSVNMVFGTNNTERMRIESGGALLVTSNDIKSSISGTYYLSGANGTAGNPSYVTYSFVDDANTGMYRSGADTLNFATGGSERMRIDSSGVVGIGASSPSSFSGSRLVVRPVVGEAGTNDVQSWEYTSFSAGSEYDLRLQQVVSSGLVKHQFNVRNGGTDYTSNLVLDRGNVGIGTSSPSTALHVLSGTGNSDVAIFSGANASRGLKISTLQGGAGDEGVDFDAHAGGSTAFHTFSTNGSERLRIDSSGNLLVGKTAANNTAAGCSVYRWIECCC